MRVGPQSFIARPAWYDRNPSIGCTGYKGEDVAPHASTTRATYTVTSGKKSIVEHIYAHITRITTATTVGRARVFVVYKPSGGSEADMAQVLLLKNNVGDQAVYAVAPNLVMSAGDQIIFRSSDLSTGGTLDLYMILKSTEYDA